LVSAAGTIPAASKGSAIRLRNSSNTPGKFLPLKDTSMIVTLPDPEFARILAHYLDAALMVAESSDAARSRASLAQL
jgi:hypothetical protein